jgi:predicted permease
MGFTTELRVAARRLRSTPSLSLAAVLSLALGLGANAIVFSWIRGALVEPLPRMVDADGLRVLAATGPGETTGTLSFTELADVRHDAPALEPIAAFTTEMHVGADENGGAERVYGALVTGRYFDALGVGITIGRGFRPDEDGAPRAHPVAVISHEFWRRRFRGDPAVGGRTISLNEERFTIVGVAPDGFWGTVVGVDTEIWVPLAMHELFLQRDLRAARDVRIFPCLARLAPGAAAAQAQVELDALGRRLAAAHPDTHARRSFTILPLWRAPWGAPALLRPMLAAMAALSALLLLLACVNLAQVQLARAHARQRAAAVQLAIGAGRGRLVREALIESVLLNAVGLAGAVLAAAWSERLLIWIVPMGSWRPRFEVALDAEVASFAVLLALASTLGIGLAPARWAARADVMGVLREESASVAGSRRAGRTTTGLVVAQVALAVMVLTGAGLLLRSLQRFQTTDPGFDPRDVLVVDYHLLPPRYAAVKGSAFHRALLERLEQNPAVADATLARWIPVGLGGVSSTSITVPGYVPAPGESLRVRLNTVGPHYFATMRIPVLRGRDFGPRDDGRSARVAAISVALAARYWPGRDPVGGTIDVSGDSYEVIAVVGDAPNPRLTDRPTTCVYIAVLQSYRPAMTLHVRAAEPRARLLDVVRREVAALDPDLLLTDPKMLADHVRDGSFRQRVGASLFGAFGLLALLLGGLGVYALLANFVEQRARELAVRMALGADTRELRRLILGRCLVIAVGGIVPGLVLASWGGSFLASQGLLGSISPTDPVTLAAVPSVVAAIALVGALAPLRRVSRIEPAALLRV